MLDISQYWYQVGPYTGHYNALWLPMYALLLFLVPVASLLKKVNQAAHKADAASPGRCPALIAKQQQVSHCPPRDQ